MALDLLTIPLLILYAIVGCVTYWFLSVRPKDAPPGPIGLPYVGYAPFLSEAVFIDFDKLGKKYKSNIIGMYLGPVFTVILNDWDAVHAAFIDQDVTFTGRPKDQFVTNYLSQGDDGEVRAIFAIEGPKWKAHHDFIHDSFEELGVRTAKLEVPVLEEITALITAIQEENGAPFNFFDLASPTSSSIVGRQISGHRWNPRSEEYHKLMEGTEDMFQLLAGSPVQVIPWTRFIPGALKTRWQSTKRAWKRHQAFLHEAVRKHEKTYEDGEIRDLVDVYIRHIKGQGPLDRITFQNEDDFLSTANLMLLAGGEASCGSLEWAILFLLHNLQVQHRIHEELDEKIGRDRPILFSDKDQLPYTTGAMYETLRLGGISFLGNPRCNIEETQLLGYHIPKRSMILMNIWAAHRNPKDWKYPEDFNPENWINDDGQFYVPECFLGFSKGSRKCPGQELAKMFLFLIFANLLQKFEFVNPDGQNLPVINAYEPGISPRPKPFKVMAIPRF